MKQEARLSKPIETMRFRLTYDGPLHASKNDPRTDDKNAIRRSLHGQVCALFSTHPTLVGWLSPNCDEVEKAGQVLPQFELKNANDESLRFIPLVCENLFLSCQVKILFLRKEPPGRLIGNNGDIDNRLLTLFDGLRMPQRVEELDQKPYPQPFMLCLLEDDRLITGVSVETDRLLVPVPDAHPDDVRLVMDVTVLARKTLYATFGFLTD
jgi:hypothetical protein